MKSCSPDEAALFARVGNRVDDGAAANRDGEFDIRGVLSGSLDGYGH